MCRYNSHSQRCDRTKGKWNQAMQRVIIIVLTVWALALCPMRTCTEMKAVIPWEILPMFWVDYSYPIWKAWGLEELYLSRVSLLQLPPFRFLWQNVRSLCGKGHYFWPLGNDGRCNGKTLPTYPNGFPKEIINTFTNKIGRPILGNKPASGTEIIQELGKEHIKTGFPIVYTSADSVFQIAACEDIIPIPELYKMCETAREILTGEHAVGRVIARPFVLKTVNSSGQTGVRISSLAPPSSTVLDHALQKWTGSGRCR